MERGLAAFGGMAALDSLQDVSRHMEGFRVDIGQSWKPGSEYTRQTVSIASILEPKTGRLFEEITSGVLGGCVAHSITIAKDRNNVSSIDASHNFIDINKLGNDVYFVRAPYNSVFVVFDDYVLVIEAGLDDSQTQEVIAAIKKAVPGKPIRSVMPTHFHHDHIGGLRGYVAEGATIVTTESIRGEVEKLVAAPYALRPDTLALHPAPLKVETFTQKRVFKDGSHAVEIYNIGPNPHAADFVIAFIPSVKVLYEADALDLFQGNLVPGRPESLDLQKKIEALGLDVETIVPAHGRLGTLDDLKQTNSMAVGR